MSDLRLRTPLSVPPDDLDWTAKVEVTEHARIRAAERLGWGNAADITAEVRASILQGRWSTIRPDWTRGLGKAEPDTGYSRYIWDQDATHCWVATVALSGLICVRTLLLDHAIKQEDAGRLRLIGGRDA